jgi:Flp pilus assembly protein TadG
MKNKSLKTVLSKFKQSAATFKRDARGNMSIIMALSTVPVFGVAGLAIDVSHVRNTMAEMQSLADRAALHGMSAGSTQSVRQLAVDDFLAVNKKSYPGLVYTATGLADANSVGVQITTDIKSTLTSFVMTTSGTNPTIRARATIAPAPITSVAPFRYCAVALDSSNVTGINASGSGSFNAVGCGFHTNSTSTAAFSSSGSGGGTADFFTAVGGVIKTGTGVFNPKLEGNQPSVVDPLNITTSCPPKPIASTSGTSVINSGSTTNPSISASSISLIDSTGSGGSSIENTTQVSINGNYSVSGSGGVTVTTPVLSIAGNLSQSSSGGAVFKSSTSITLGGDLTYSGSGGTRLETPVVYIFGKVNTLGSGGLFAPNTTLVLCGPDARINMTGSGGLFVSAPTTGPRAGYAVMGDAQVTKPMTINGSGGSYIRGIWYTPKAGLEFAGSGGLNQTTSNYFPLIVSRLTFSGSGGVKIGIHNATPNPASNNPGDAYPVPTGLIIPQNEVYLTAY